MNQVPNQGYVTPLQQLPNSTAVLVLGILSIVSCWCFGIVGLIMGIIALVMAGKAKKDYTDNFGRYSETSYKNMNAGKICAIIGLCLSGLMFISFIVRILIIGTVASFIPWKDILNL